MPTVLRNGPYRFYFYSHEPHEPRHIQVDRDDLSAKFWLEPVALARNFGFSAKELGTIQSLVADERVAAVSFSSDSLSMSLKDGRTITVPLAWYPKLLHASPKQLQNWKVAGGGYGIHWPDLDEDLSREGLLCGAPTPRHPAKA